MALTPPLKTMAFTARVMLHPHQMNEDIYLNLKSNLVRQVQGRCNKLAFVHRVHKILDYTLGELEAENFCGSAVYSMRYLASAAVVSPGMRIVARVTSNPSFFLAANGPIHCIVHRKRSDIGASFLVDSKQVVDEQSGEVVRDGTLVVVVLNQVRFSQDDVKVLAIGFLDRLATADEAALLIGQDAQRSAEPASYVDEATVQTEFNEDGALQDARVDATPLTSNYIDI